MTLNLDPQFRRTVQALAFTGAGMALLAFAGWQVGIVWQGEWPAAAWAQRLTIIGVSLYIVLGLLGLVLTGLSMTVALRQVSGKFMGGEFSASGGGDDAGNKLQDAGAALIDAGASVKGETA